MAQPLDQDPEKASKAFGNRVKEVRARKGISQDDLSRATDVHSTAIGRMERGSREPRLTTILKLAHGLDVKPGELIDDLDAD
jgi:transcriptional regulator with XRE-family HTH domain